MSVFRGSSSLGCLIGWWKMDRASSWPKLKRSGLKLKSHFHSCFLNFRSNSDRKGLESMSGPAWTQRPSRWPPSRDNSAEAVQQTIPRPALSGGSSSTAIPPAQEAPYLTHLTRHQGAFTLTAPPNMGRRRHSGEEETQQPVAGPSTSPPKRIKKKKGKKSHLDPEITNAVINAGRRTPSPSHAVTQDTRYRPALSSNASERPSLLDRNSGDEGMSAGRISLVDERDYEARVAENRGPEYARGDAWDYGTFSRLLCSLEFRSYSAFQDSTYR